MEVGNEETVHLSSLVVVLQLSVGVIAQAQQLKKVARICDLQLAL
jgi:hypothetical protein